jgi:uncharacterized repeat protein (TIGR03843 family)
VRQPARSGWAHLPAPERAVRQLTTDRRAAEAALGPLRDGAIEVVGRLVESSNNAFLVRVTHPAAETLAWEPRPPSPLAGLGHGLYAVWKPTAGERPLFDFPARTLTRREVAAFAVSEALGWRIVPPTVLRDGPHGEGMLQCWIEVDESADVLAMLEAADARLRRIALFDAVVNNTDRKGGHLLPTPEGHVYAVDHGVTFSVVPKLRTILWQWEGQALDRTELTDLGALLAALAPGAGLSEALGSLLADEEVDATRERIDDLLEARVFPGPSPDWPAIPWPPF